MASATVLLAWTNWLLGNIGPTRNLIEEAKTCAAETDHVPTQAFVWLTGAFFETLRGDAERTLRNSDAILHRKDQIQPYLALGFAIASWARARLGEREAGLTGLREWLQEYLNQRNKLFVPFCQGLFAQVEADSDNADVALTRVENALSLARDTGEHWSDAFLHRIRGEILLKRDSANTAPAEEAFLTAISVAQQQKAKSFELRAALSLAKLYQSASRAADAHAVLAPALEGFSPTPEFPEIEEAQKLLAKLAATDEVRNVSAARRQRVELQVAYANALISARGHGAKETTAAFVRARDLAANIEDPAERFPIYYGIWVGSLVRGELSVMRDIAEAAGRDAENNPGLSEACTGWRIAGLTRSYEGDFVAARASLEKALAAFNPERDHDLTFRFAQDVGVSATIHLAKALWAQGEIQRANDLAIASVERADWTGHVATIVYAHCIHAFLFIARRDPARAAVAVNAFAALARKHAMPVWMAYADFLEPWVRWHNGHHEADLAAMRDGIARAHGQEVTLYVPLLETALARAEAEADQFDAALASISHALAETERTGQRWFEAETHCVRGEILLKRDPTNTASAEQAFLAAVAVAQQQKARTFKLRAALSLSKLFQSTGRAADVHAVLAPALAGFSPTPEFPEIEQAQTQLAKLGKL
jgi:predicted ATPase